MSIRQGNNTIAGGPWDFEKQITNCITQIPQDIKLELNNGTLTLKAGSKVYVPNGSGVFDNVTIESDQAYSVAIDSTPLFMFINHNRQLQRFRTTQCFSGTSAPSGQTYMVWYDTTNNLIKYTGDGGSTWTSGWSFPICIIHGDGTQISNIDQVFNGFGYIGSIVFALPNVKCLSPYGRNADGTLKNREITTSSVLTYTRSGSGDYTLQIASGTQFYDTNYRIYKEDINYNWTTYTDTVANDCTVGKLTRTTNGTITSLTPKTAFHAVDYNDSSTISGWSMPSSRYIDLTLGASGTTYTAPANGWFYLNKIAGGTAYIHMYRDDYYYGVFNRTTISSDHLECLLPCRKGDVITVVYSATGTTNVFRFYYAEGENV